MYKELRGGGWCSITRECASLRESADLWCVVGVEFHAHVSFAAALSIARYHGFMMGEELEA